MSDILEPDALHKMHAWWRAADCLSVGQIYLQNNPLLAGPAAGLPAAGTTTASFGMVVLNELDGCPLALDVVRRVPRFAKNIKRATARYRAPIERHKLYIAEHGDDLLEVRDWRWQSRA